MRVPYVSTAASVKTDIQMGSALDSNIGEGNFPIFFALKGLRNGDQQPFSPFE